MGKERVYQGPLHEGMKYRLTDGLSIHTIGGEILKDQAYLRGPRVSLIPPSIDDRAAWDRFRFIGPSPQTEGQELDVGAVYSFNFVGSKAVIQVLSNKTSRGENGYLVRSLAGNFMNEGNWNLHSLIWIDHCVLLFSADEMGVVPSSAQTTRRSSASLSMDDPRIVWPVELVRNFSDQEIERRTRTREQIRERGAGARDAWNDGCYDVTLQETAGDAMARLPPTQRVVCRNSATTAYPPGDAEQDRKIAALTWAKAQTGRAAGIDAERRTLNLGRIRDIYRSGAGDDIDGLPNREVWRR